MKLVWTAVPLLIATAAVAGCSSSDSGKTEASGSTTTTAAVTGTPTADPLADDDAERGGGVRVLIGQTGKVLIPADAVMDIKVPESWNPATATALRCTATDRNGTALELRRPDGVYREQVRETSWVTQQTFSAPAGDEVTVGCQDPESAVAPDSSITFIRVVPRGVMP
ncbi:hypothetical protein AB0L82_14510 [Nocardia sp. NPDC052001]|uniref:hypothetical protein n=1 Tax=Nocardia sp. NPDC052001 TaxID=3154853 RepID=UPI003434FB2B